MNRKSEGRVNRKCEERKRKNKKVHRERERGKQRGKREKIGNYSR